MRDAKMRPLAIDLYCGLGGWAEGFLSEGWRIIGFDIEPWTYPGEMVLQDVTTLDGSQFKNADMIVASPPCQAYSYRAMPWKRAKTLPPPDNTLFETCFRIQREASEAASRKIPMVVENVQGAQKWVGRAKWHYGSFYLWGDVPALMPIGRGVKIPGFRFNRMGSFQTAAMKQQDGYKSTGMNWSDRAKRGQDFTRIAGRQSSTRRTDEAAGIKNGGDWFGKDASLMRNYSSKSNKRRHASAMIAKIPFPLARHIARVFRP